MMEGADVKSENEVKKVKTSKKRNGGGGVTA